MCRAQKYLDKAFLDPNCQVLVIFLGTKTRWHFILLYLMPWIDSFWFFPLCSTYCLVFVIHYLHYDFVIWGNLMFTTLICTHVDSAENFLDHLPWVFHSEFSMGQEKQTSCTAVLPCWSWMEDTDISFFFFLFVLNFFCDLNKTALNLLKFCKRVLCSWETGSVVWIMFVLVF